MSDIDIAVADSLKVLDLKRPIREADIRASGHHVGYGPLAHVRERQPYRGMGRTQAHALRRASVPNVRLITVASVSMGQVWLVLAIERRRLT